MSTPSRKLYIALISIHGLIRGKNLELGRDADTGGQTLYVLELAHALSRHPEVARVDLITRLVIDESVATDYQIPIEPLSNNLRIVRIEAGPERYIAKEQLWDYLDGFADNLAQFFNENDAFPDLIHSHYADAGLVAVHLSNLLAIPLIHTGHSLGRVKRSRLLASGLKPDEIEHDYNMSRRIEAEELTLATAKRVITSTHQEIEQQYELYDYYQPDLMRVIPPGTDLTKFKPPVGNEAQSAVYQLLVEYLNQPDKPMILALSRPDIRKNIGILIEAFGQSIELQKLANLVIIAGNRDDIDDLELGAQEVFHDLLVAIDRYNLYGKVAMPKHHKREQVPMIYSVAANSGGIFVNPALTEPFGLTLIEAAASGLPVVATEDGGPQDIIGNCRNGVLIDPLDANNISNVLLLLLKDSSLRQGYIKNGLKGVREHYSWQAHAVSYLEMVQPIIADSELLHGKPVERRARLNVELAIEKESPYKPVKRRTRLYSDRAIVSELDLNLIGDDDALQQLCNKIRQHRKTTKFAICTGRRLDMALRIMRKHAIPEPDILITSGGTEIYHAPELSADTAWARHIDYQWTPHKITALLDGYPGLEKQAKLEQSRFKLSYYIDPNVADIDEIKRLLLQEEQSVHVQMAFGQFLDILPMRASKGMALRYVADRWQIPLERVFVAGGSGADEDMMRGNTLAAVVANRHHEELSQLTDVEKIYFSSKPFAAGILEAIEYYDFFNQCRDPKQRHSL
ncbi:MAG: HAD family hydrolase [Gammaproteobacteria bacterium]|nr:HAD family hydrolase [Gammaproteobacteria bacterium]